MRRTPAIVFSCMAVLFYGIGHLLLPTGFAGGTAVTQLAIVPASAATLFLLSTMAPAMAAAARVLSSLWPLAAMTMLTTGGGQDRTDWLAALGSWPFVAAAASAGLALVPPDGRQLPTLAIFPFGAVLATCTGTLLVIVAPGLAPLVLSTPYHFVILLAFAATLVAMADAAATALPPARERLIRALSAMMPLLGFLGTIAGLIKALASLPDLFGAQGDNSAALGLVLQGLSTAFETTLVGLVGAAITGFLLLLLVDREATRK